MKKFSIFIFAAVCAFALSACSEDGSTVENCKHEAYQVNLFASQPALAEVWWGDDYDETASRDAVVKHYDEIAKAHAAEGARIAAGGGGCSSYHKDNFHARNIDWNMSDFSSIIVHMPKNEKKGVKYASVSLCTGDPYLTVDFINANKEIPENYRQLIPSLTVDGMNECGVAINHNVVPYDGKPFEENGELPTPMVCRYVLDHCATAREAIDLLSKKTVTQSMVGFANDYSHFFISDPTSSYVVEWIDGVFTATEFKADGQGNYISANGEPAIMTNFFVGLAEKYGVGSKEFFKNHQLASGYERFLTVKEQLPAAKTLDNHFDILKSVWFRAYSQGKRKWCSDECGLYGYDEATGKAYWFYPTRENIHWMEDDDVYAAAQALVADPEYQASFDDFNNNWDKCVPNNPYWYTQHSVIYDLKNLKGHLMMQEGMHSTEILEIGVK